MQTELAKLMTALLALLGPASKETPAQLQLKTGDLIVAIGDSITEGGGYLRDIDAVLAKQHPELKLPAIINVGVSGQKAEDLVARFQKDVVDRKPQWVTISIGINDVWHRLKDPHDPAVLEKYAQNVAKMVDLAQAADIKVILVAPTLIEEDPKSAGNQRLPMYVDAYKKIAAEKKCGLANLHQLFLDALAKKPAGEKGNWLTGDGVHMNPRGDALMALGILRAIGVPDAEIAAADAK